LGASLHGMALACRSYRSLGDRNKTLWASYVVSAGGKKVYFSGDTGYCDVFKETGVHFKGFDLALIPIGAYEPRWFMKPQHVDPQDAVQMHVDLQAKKSIGMHWGTFVLSDEAIDEPPKAIAETLKARSLHPDEFITVPHGQITVIS